MRLNWADGDYWKTAYQQGHINEYLSIIIKDERKRERETKKMEFLLRKNDKKFENDKMSEMTSINNTVIYGNRTYDEKIVAIVIVIFIHTQ